MIKWLKNNMLLILVVISLGLNVVVLANNKILSEQVSYSNNKTNEVTVNGALNELFSAVDINEKLGNTDNISSIGDGTVVGAITTTNNTVNTLYNNRSHIGMVIQSTTLNTMEKVKAIYGGTTWVKIEGRFLLGQSSSYAINSTGGAASNTFTPAGKNTGGAVQSHTLTLDQIPSHRHTLAWNYGGSGGGATGIAWNGTNGSFVGYDNTPVLPEGGGKGHSHGFTQPTFTGTAQTITNMPPYKVVYIWERTA